MKKSLALLVSFFLCASSMFSFSNNLGFGIRFPSPSEAQISSGDKDGGKLKSAMAGLDIQYLGYFNSGFSFKGNAGISFSKLNYDTPAGSTQTSDSYANNVYLRLGVGYGIIRTEMLYFGLFGFFGFDGLMYSDSLNSTEITKDLIIGGIDPTLVVTLGQRFSLFGSLGIGVGFGEISFEKKINGSPKKTTYDLKPQYVWYPAVGVSWKF